MKNHSKVGNKSGRPTYRTASEFRNRKNLAINNFKNFSNNFKSRPIRLTNRGK